MVGIALWQLANVLRGLTTNPPTKLRVLHVFLAVVVPLFTYSLLWFALAYSDASQRRIRAVGGLFLVESVVISAGIALDPEFLQTVGGTVYQGPVSVLNVRFERWTVLNRTFRTTASVRQLYHQAVWVTSGALLVRYTFRQGSDAAVGKATTLTIGIGTMVLVSSLLSFGALPPEWALTDVGLGILAVGLAVATFRYQLLDLPAVGRQQFVEEIDDPLVFVDDTDEVVYSNPAARQLFDVGSSWKGMDMAEFFAPHAERIESGAQASGPSGTMELDGTDRYFDVNTTMIRTAAGNPGGQAIVLREVTALEETNQRLDRYASMVSHDLRTPLTTARFQADRLARERSDERIEALETDLGRMESIIDDMLQLARAGESVEATEACSLGPLVWEVWGTLETDGVELECAIGDVAIEADPARLFQVLENLLRNSIAHNDTPLTVRGGLIDGNGDLADGDAATPWGVFVEDDGRGIPGDGRGEVFEHGYTTAQDGNGYGLSIVRAIVEAHGWQVRATEGSDGGARFEITGFDVD